MSEPAPRSPGVPYPPPLVFVSVFVVGWLLERGVRRLPLASSPSSTLLVVAGTMAIAIGLLITIWGLWTFWRARTGIMPHHPASRVVMDGPYRFSRNPMYVGLSLLYAGLSLRLNMGWPLLLLPIALLLLYRLVIRREERYLASAFGEEYEAYRRRVRRWI